MSPWQCKRADRATVKFNCSRGNVLPSQIYYTFLFILKMCSLNTFSVSDFKNCSCSSMIGTWVWASDAACLLHFPWIIRCLFPLWLIYLLPLHAPPGPHFGAFGGKSGTGHLNRMGYFGKTAGEKGVRERAMHGSGCSVCGKKNVQNRVLRKYPFRRRMLL